MTHPLVVTRGAPTVQVNDVGFGNNLSHFRMLAFSAWSYLWLGGIQDDLR